MLLTNLFSFSLRSLQKTVKALLIFCMSFASSFGSEAANFVSTLMQTKMKKKSNQIYINLKSIFFQPYISVKKLPSQSPGFKAWVRDTNETTTKHTINFILTIFEYDVSRSSCHNLMMMKRFWRFPFLHLFFTRHFLAGCQTLI